MPPALYFTVELWVVGCLGSWVPSLGFRNAIMSLAQSTPLSVGVSTHRFDSTSTNENKHTMFSNDVVLTALNGTTAVQSQPLQKAPWKWR